MIIHDPLNVKFHACVSGISLNETEKAKLPAEIGEVHIAPETVKTENAVADAVEKPVPTEHITPVGDPIIIPTPKTQSNKPKKSPLTTRPFIRGESKL